MTSVVEALGPRSALLRRARTVAALTLLCVAVGTGLRIWTLASTQGALDGDEAVWGLMARHVLDGQLSTFYWGQAYGGSQETLVAAALFWLFGASVTVLKVVPILFWSAAALLLWRVARRLLDDERGRLAAALFWAWPVFFVWKSTRAHGFYGAGLVCGLWAMLVALRLAERESKLDAVQLGLALGLGWWATPQIAILGFPALVWLLFKRPSRVRGLLYAAPAFVLGSLPWWIYNVRHDWASLHVGADESSKLGHLHNLFSATLPTALGLRLPFSLSWFPSLAVGVPLYAAALAGFAWLLVRRPPRLGLALVAALAFPLIYTASPYTWLNFEPRYLTLFTPVLVVLVAYAARPGWRAVTITVVCLALSIGGLALIERRDLTASHSDGAVVVADIEPLLRTLRQHHVDRLYADYWIAYRIDFESREQIVAAKSSATYELRNGRVVPIGNRDPGSQGRYPAYNRIVAASRQAAFVFTRGSSVEPDVEPLLRRVGYTRVAAPGFDVWVAPAA